MENRQQESYQVTHWTKRMEWFRTMCGVWWKSLVSINLNPRRQREDWFILNINGSNTSTSQDIGSRLPEPLWAGNAHWVTLSHPAYVSPSDASLRPSIITAIHLLSPAHSISVAMNPSTTATHCLYQILPKPHTCSWSTHHNSHTPIGIPTHCCCGHLCHRHTPASVPLLQPRTWYLCKSGSWERIGNLKNLSFFSWKTRRNIFTKQKKHTIWITKTEREYTADW